jgi:hypothetical protein
MSARRTATSESTTRESKPSVGLVADCRTHRLQAGGGSVHALRRGMTFCQVIVSDDGHPLAPSLDIRENEIRLLGLCSAVNVRASLSTATQLADVGLPRTPSSHRACWYHGDSTATSGRRSRATAGGPGAGQGLAGPSVDGAGNQTAVSSPRAARADSASTSR